MLKIIVTVKIKFRSLLLSIKINIMSKHYHPFHLVDPSPWPYVGAFSALGLTTGGVLYMHSYVLGDLLLFGSLTLVILVMIV